jgi:hypothetical protein
VEDQSWQRRDLENVRHRLAVLEKEARELERGLLRGEVGGVKHFEGEVRSLKERVGRIEDRQAEEERKRQEREEAHKFWRNVIGTVVSALILGGIFAAITFVRKLMEGGLL